MNDQKTSISPAGHFWTIKDVAQVFHLADHKAARRRLRELGVKARCGGRGRWALYVPAEVIQAVLDSD
jgi:hypothetical protein